MLLDRIKELREEYVDRTDLLSVQLVKQIDFIFHTLRVGTVSQVTDEQVNKAIYNASLAHKYNVQYMRERMDDVNNIVPIVDNYTATSAAMALLESRVYQYFALQQVA